MSAMSRRALARYIAGAVIVARVGTKAFAAPIKQRAPVVSFFLDQPYLDMTGRGEPFEPPQGLRAGEPLAALSEIELRHLNPFI